MVLVISGDVVQRLLDFPSAMAALADAHIAHARGQVVMPVRLSMAYDDRPSEMEAMPAYLGSAPAFGVKVVTYVGTNVARGVPAIHAVIALFDPDTLRPLAIIDGRHSTAIRTAACSALATRMLAREDSRSLAVIGAGVQGWNHLEAMLEVRPIEIIRVFDADEERATSIARQARTEHPALEMQVAHSVREAVEGAEIICTCTTSSSPVLEWAWIAPGSHINAIGAHSPHSRELATDVVTHVRIVVDSRDAALKEAGDFLIPIDEGALSPDDVDAELGQVLGGMKPARPSANAVTLYKACGVALQDVAVAKLVLDRATAQGLGAAVDF